MKSTLGKLQMCIVLELKWKIKIKIIPLGESLGM
jgi:hypothetical protein